MRGPGAPANLPAAFGGNGYEPHGVVSCPWQAFSPPASAPPLAQPAEQAAPPAPRRSTSRLPRRHPAPDYSAVEEKSTDLGKGLYEITGAGGNTTVAVGSKGIIVVDTQFAPLYDKLRAKITSLSDKPVLYVVNTHYHADHTSGNALPSYKRQGHVIVAHPQVAARMLPIRPRADGSPGTPAGEKPAQGALWRQRHLRWMAGSITAQLVHVAPAHTDGDTIVSFLNADVIATGDVVTSASYPNIDVAAGGSIDGMIAGANYVIAHADAGTRIVPGHGALTDKAGVVEYRDMLKTARDRIAKAKASGMTEQQVVDANLLKDLDKRWKPSAPPSSRFPINVYRSLK